MEIKLCVVRSIVISPKRYGWWGTRPAIGIGREAVAGVFFVKSSLHCVVSPMAMLIFTEYAGDSWLRRPNGRLMITLRRRCPVAADS